MPYINVGAKDGVGIGRNSEAGFKTKKAFKDAVVDRPGEVFLYGTSPFTPFEGTVNEIEDEVSYAVVGPDPYTKRDWYATVKKTNGKVRVS